MGNTGLEFECCSVPGGLVVKIHIKVSITIKIIIVVVIKIHINVSITIKIIIVVVIKILIKVSITINVIIVLVIKIIFMSLQGRATPWQPGHIWIHY